MIKMDVRKEVNYIIKEKNLRVLYKSDTNQVQINGMGFHSFDDFKVIVREILKIRGEKL